MGTELTGHLGYEKHETGEKSTLNRRNRELESVYPIVFFDHSIRDYWSTEHTQIYRAIAALAVQQQVSCPLVEQEDKPDGNGKLN